MLTKGIHQAPLKIHRVFVSTISASVVHGRPHFFFLALECATLFKARWHDPIQGQRIDTVPRHHIRHRIPTVTARRRRMVKDLYGKFQGQSLAAPGGDGDLHDQSISTSGQRAEEGGNEGFGRIDGHFHGRGPEERGAVWKARFGGRMRLQVPGQLVGLADLGRCGLRGHLDQRVALDGVQVWDLGERLRRVEGSTAEEISYRHRPIGWNYSSVGFRRPK